MKSSLARHKKGFTLVELLVVIGIIAVLYGIIFGSVTQSKARSRDNKRISDIKQIQLALAQFFDACNQYPSDITADTQCPGDSTITFGAYLSQIPTDPSTNMAYHYVQSIVAFCIGTKFEIALPSNYKDNDVGIGACAGGDGAGGDNYMIKGP